MSGPHSADSLFHAEARRHYDAAVAMYHDQALIPIKTLAFDTAVNVTLGLPFVRTSPDHGTAFSIAGTGKASPTSLIAALKLAVGAGRAARMRLRHECAGAAAVRRPAAPARGHRRPRDRSEKEPRPELHPRSQPDAAHRPAGRAARCDDRCRGRAGTGRPHAGAADGRRAARRGGRARSALRAGTRADRRRLSRAAHAPSRRRAGGQIGRGCFPPAVAAPSSSRTFPTTSRRAC